MSEAKGGRPPLPEGEKLSVAITLRFTPQEADEIYTRAYRHGVPAGPLLRQLIRQILSGAVSRTPKPG